MTPPSRVFCPSCREVVFESHVPMKLHRITFERVWDGSRRWYSRDFQMVVHKCGVDLAAAMEVIVSDSEETP